MSLAKKKKKKKLEIVGRTLNAIANVFDTIVGTTFWNPYTAVKNVRTEVSYI